MSVIQLDLKMQVQTSGSTQINYNSECISWIILLINSFSIYKTNKNDNMYKTNIWQQFTIVLHRTQQIDSLRHMQKVGFHISLYIQERWLRTFGPHREKTCLQRVANNKGADQPASPRSQMGDFVIRVLESTIPKLATSEISFF